MPSELVKNALSTEASKIAHPIKLSPPKTSVLKILQCSNLGGMEQVAYSLLHELTESDEFRFSITSPRPFGPGVRFIKEVDSLAQDFEYKGKFGWRNFRAFRNHVRLLAQDTDLIWLTGTCACSLAAIRDLPQRKIMGHHFHHMEGRFSLIKWFGFYHGLCRNLDAITYPTDFTRNEAITIAPWLEKRAHVIHYGFPVAYENEEERIRMQRDARGKLNLPADALIVGNAGWLIDRKRFDIFLETAVRIREHIPHAYFVICGGGPLENDLKERAIRLGLSGSVLFTGWLQDISTHYKAWDVCLFNSDFDALGRTPMEAASYGCLAVASVLYGGLSEFMDSGKNGILLNRHDTNKLANEIVELFRNPTKAQEFREAAAAKLRSDYSVEQAIASHRSLFEST